MYSIHGIGLGQRVRLLLNIFSRGKQMFVRTQEDKYMCNMVTGYIEIKQRSLIL